MIGGGTSFYEVEKRLSSKMVKMKTKAIPILMITLIGICILAPMVSAEPAEEWGEKGRSFIVSGEYEKAIECFNKAVEECYKAIELDPNDADAYNSSGFAYLCLGPDERAIKDLNREIELDPNIDEAYTNRNLAFLALSKSKKQKLIPGFEAVFAITGLLAVAYLSRIRGE